MNSCLYQGVLRHRRLQPKAHHFVYRLFMAWLDLDELDKLPEAGIRRNRGRRRTVRRRLSAGRAAEGQC